MPKLEQYPDMNISIGVNVTYLPEATIDTSGILAFVLTHVLCHIITVGLHFTNIAATATFNLVNSSLSMVGWTVSAVFDLNIWVYHPPPLLTCLLIINCLKMGVESAYGAGAQYYFTVGPNSTLVINSFELEV